MQIAILGKMHHCYLFQTRNGVKKRQKIMQNISVYYLKIFHDCCW